MTMEEHKQSELVLQRLQMQKNKSFQRFTEQMNDQKESNLLYHEFGSDMILSGFHPAIQRTNELSSKLSLPINYKQIMDRLVEHFHLQNIEIPKRIQQYVAKKLKINTTFNLKSQSEQTIIPMNSTFCVSYKNIELFVKFIYIYTIEEPSLYSVVNKVLSNKKFWNEIYGSKYDIPDDISHTENILLDYSLCLIDSLFLLTILNVIDGYSSGTSLRSNLYRGIDITQDEFDDQTWQRSRWTGFVSVTDNVIVAQKFGEPYGLNKIGTHLFEKIFYIANLSAFPEESEYLILPGIHLSGYKGNKLIWYWRREAALKKAKQWIQSKDNTGVLVSKSNKKHDCVMLCNADNIISVLLCFCFFLCIVYCVVVFIHLKF
eukprot:535492_1